jgi:hypothetical protein
MHVRAYKCATNTKPQITNNCHYQSPRETQQSRLLDHGDCCELVLFATSCSTSVHGHSIVKSSPAWLCQPWSSAATSRAMAASRHRQPPPPPRRAPAPLPKGSLPAPWAFHVPPAGRGPDGGGFERGSRHRCCVSPTIDRIKTPTQKSRGPLTFTSVFLLYASTADPKQAKPTRKCLVKLKLESRTACNSCPKANYST